MTEFGKWQPIDTAPKDGREIITCVEGFIPIVGAMWISRYGRERWSIDPETFMEEGHFKDYFLHSKYDPTHWMPLPELPEASE